MNKNVLLMNQYNYEYFNGFGYFWLKIKGPCYHFHLILWNWLSASGFSLISTCIFLSDLNQKWYTCTRYILSYMHDTRIQSTVKHVYSDQAYNEMTLITKHLEIPGKHSMYFFINFTLTAKLHITKSRL